MNAQYHYNYCTFYLFSFDLSFIKLLNNVMLNLMILFYFILLAIVTILHLFCEIFIDFFPS